MYLNQWSSREEMIEDFWPSWAGYKLTTELDNAEILLASYGTPSYEGYAFVLFRRAGILWEVNASHCSCRGLEDQWEPEETNVASLQHRLDHGDLGSDDYTENPFADELRSILASLT